MVMDILNLQSVVNVAHGHQDIITSPLLVVLIVLVVRYLEIVTLSENL